MSSQSSPVSSTFRPAPQVLESIAAELSDLTEAADRLQVVLSGVLTEAARADGALLIESQSLDMMVQRLQGLRQYVEALGPACSADWIVDSAPAVRAVRLSDLARRLSAGPDARETLADVTDDLELF